MNPALLNRIPVLPTQSSSVVMTLRKAGFKASVQSDGARDYIETDATDRQAIFTIGSAYWIDMRYV